MMRRPSFQFYPGDWRANVKLAAATVEQQGIWINLMCLMHESDEYGVLRIPLSGLGRMIGVSAKKVRGLADLGILKGCDSGVMEPLVYVPRHARKFGEPVSLIENLNGPVWYSSRMVRDEYKRNVRAANSGDTKPDTKAFTDSVTERFTKGRTEALTKGRTNGRTFPEDRRQKITYPEEEPRVVTQPAGGDF